MPTELLKRLSANLIGLRPIKVIEPLSIYPVEASISVQDRSDTLEQWRVGVEIRADYVMPGSNPVEMLDAIAEAVYGEIYHEAAALRALVHEVKKRDRYMGMELEKRVNAILSLCRA